MPNPEGYKELHEFPSATVLEDADFHLVQQAGILKKYSHLLHDQDIETELIGPAIAAAIASHEADSNPHPGYATDGDLAAHTGASAPHSGHELTSAKGQPNGYASLDTSGKVPDAQLPAGLARDSEVAAAVTAHEALPDPHPGYLTAAEGTAAFDALGAASAAVAAHVLDADPHTGYLTPAEGDAAYSALLHAARHANTGADELNVGGLSGELADPQPPKTHAASHASGQPDAVTPAAIGASPAGHDHTGVYEPAGVDWTEVGGKPATFPPDAHALGGSTHQADTLANLNAKVSDADVPALAGQLGGTPASPDVRGLRETGGPTLLTVGAVADGQYLRRSGATIVGGTPAGGGGEDVTLPTATPIFVDDFIFSSTEAGEVGTLGWSFTNGSMVATPAVADHPGVTTRRSGTTASQVASFYPGAAVGTAEFTFDDFDTVYWVVSLVTSGADFIVRFGVGADASANPPVHGVFIERLAADTSWFGVSRNGSLQTRTAALLAQDILWHTFRIRRLSATQVGFQVDGGTEVVISASNIPDAADLMVPFLQIIPTTTTARDIKLDFFSLKLVPPVR